MTVEDTRSGAPDSLASAALEFASLLSVLAGGEPATELLPGVAHHTGACTVARTASATVPNGRRWEIGPRAVLIGPDDGLSSRPSGNRKTPPAVLDFLAAFDAGEFPALLSEPVAVDL